MGQQGHPNHRQHPGMARRSAGHHASLHINSGKNNIITIINRHSGLWNSGNKAVKWVGVHWSSGLCWSVTGHRVCAGLSPVIGFVLVCHWSSGLCWSGTGHRVCAGLALCPLRSSLKASDIIVTISSSSSSVSPSACLSHLACHLSAQYAPVSVVGGQGVSGRGSGFDPSPLSRTCRSRGARS